MVSLTVNTACPPPSVVSVDPAVPLTSMVEWPEPWDRVTDFPVVTGSPVVSLSVTVIRAALTPSATTDVVLAATVELLGEVAVTTGAVPSPGLSPWSSPSPVVIWNGAEKRWG